MKTRNNSYLIGFIVTIALFSGCGPTFQTATNIDQGRQALFRHDNPSALTYFQDAANAEPNYIYGSELREGTLSFLGRAQYLNSQFAPAQSTLQKALAQHKSDNLARLYLGMNKARQGDRTSGLRDMQSGTKGIGAFLNYITTNFAGEFGQYWDPNQSLRKSVQSNLAMMSQENVDWAALFSNSEALALNFEQEPDRARSQEEHQLELERNR
jgi:hypothetical protein